MASRIIPKNLRVKYIPPFPSNFSITVETVKITYAATAFTASAARIFTEAYSAFNESNVVKEPAPASNGKTSGTNVALFAKCDESLKISISSTISSDIRNIITAPATANEFISTPKRLSIQSPTKKKRNISAKE